MSSMVDEEAVASLHAIFFHYAAYLKMKDMATTSQLISFRDSAHTNVFQAILGLGLKSPVPSKKTPMEELGKHRMTYIPFYEIPIHSARYVLCSKTISITFFVRESIHNVLFNSSHYTTTNLSFTSKH